MPTKKSGNAPVAEVDVGSVFKVLGDGDIVVKGVTCIHAAKSLQVSPKRVARAVRAGKLEGGQRGRDWWVEAQHLRKVLEAGGWHSLDIRPGPKGPRKDEARSD